jgi:hypothetical protein
VHFHHRCGAPEKREHEEKHSVVTQVSRENIWQRMAKMNFENQADRKDAISDRQNLKKREAGDGG